MTENVTTGTGAKPGTGAKSYAKAYKKALAAGKPEQEARQEAEYAQQRAVNRKAAAQNTRPKRWATAVSEATEALGILEDALSQFTSAMEELKSVQEEYSEWKDNLPENLANSPVGEKLEEISNLDFDQADQIESAISDARSVVDEAEGVELPRGFGND